MKSYIYIASPYTHKNKKVMDKRFKQVLRLAAKLKLDGHVVFSPIVHSHMIATQFPKIKTNWDFWKFDDTVFLKRSSELWVYCIPGWDKSVGVAAEIAIARKYKKPIKFINKSRSLCRNSKKQ